MKSKVRKADLTKRDESVSEIELLDEGDLFLFSTSLKKNWGHLFNRNIEVQLIGQNEISFAGIVKTAQVGSAYFTGISHGQSVPTLYNFGHRLTMGMVDILLGGKGEGIDLARELSNTDYKMMGNVLHELLIALSQGLQLKSFKKTSYTASLGGPELITGIFEQERFLLLTFCVNIDHLSEEFQIALPREIVLAAKLSR